MHSEFQHVELDQVRYSLVWEDYETIFSSLQYKNDDHLMIITSAGCNVLNSLLRPLATVTAIDLNPVQNSLLDLKMHTIRNHDYPTFASLLGLRGQNAVTAAWATVKKTLVTEKAEFWEPYFQSYPGGLMLFGKLERYILSFGKLLDDNTNSRLKELLMFDNVNAQYDYFINNLDRTNFRTLFVNFFNEQNLSKGRDTKLFKYAEEPAGETFYQRLVLFLKTYLVKDNFYFKFFFFGLDQQVTNLPPCYQSGNFDTLQSNLHKIKIMNAEAIEYLLSEPGAKITRASLSNIFEYTSHDAFKNVCTELGKRRPLLRFVYWNLLQEQVAGHPDAPFQPIFQEQNQSSCFYFKNSCTMQVSDVFVKTSLI